MDEILPRLFRPAKTDTSDSHRLSGNSRRSRRTEDTGHGTASHSGHDAPRHWCITPRPDPSGYPF
ncbi:hypothetical protein [Xenorhabdus bovienii]|uniref:hypothetical protein n=1 Tax=Xenorhabdus bovienii TaxID=40576 RepID=UPI00301E3C7D